MARQGFSAEEILQHVLLDSDDESQADDLEDLWHSDSDEEADSSPSTSATAIPIEIDDQLPSMGDVQPEFAPSGRIIRSKRLVNSIDSYLDMNNYDAVEFPDTLKSYTTFVEKPKNRQEGGVSITWSNARPVHNGRRGRANIISGPIGVRGEAKEAKTPRQAWELFFSLNILNIIVQETNRKIATLISQLPERILDDSRYCYFGPTNNEEMLAFVELEYFRGLLGQAGHSTDVLFNQLQGHPVFSATMSKNRFKFLFSNISFDDQNTRPQRWKNDRLAAFRVVFEMFNENCGKHVIPGDYLSLDKTLYPMRTQIAFKQYNPNKPAKYGLLFKSVNASRFPYTFAASVYSGKPKEEPFNFYVRGTEELVKGMVMSLEQHGDLQGRNILYDRFYTSIPLAQWLLDRGITSAGTLNAIRRGIPLEVKQVSGREKSSYEIYWQTSEADLSLHSYVVKTKNSGMRNVLMLTTMQPLLGITKDDGKKKPGLYKLYDFTKGGTDIIDQRMGWFIHVQSEVPTVDNYCVCLLRRCQSHKK